MIDLSRLEKDSGKAGARDKFERLIARLIKIKFSDAQEIRPNPGDWSIDVFVGKFTSGDITVWQAKYFPDAVDDSQKDQIRKSFNQILEMSKKKGFKVGAWTLCIPTILDGDSKIWWEKWAREKQKVTGISIRLQERLDIVTMLQTPEAYPLCIEFNLADEAELIREERTIEPLPPKESREYDRSLFILKLLAAEVTETQSAKKQFFNAEIVSKEILYKKDKQEIAELNGLYEKIQSLWETRFIEASQSTDIEAETRRVYPIMLKTIEDKNNESLYCHRLPISFFHKKGLMQQLANICTIGWTPDFRSLDKRWNPNGT
jgi:hypothetical protein